MMKLKRRTIFLILALGLLLTLTGCLGLGSGKKVDDVKIKEEIAQRINSFKIAVEQYNVQDMLGFLYEENFKLTIIEGENSPYEKDYQTLSKELREKEKEELRWRKPIAEGGEGYILTMDLGTLTHSNITATGAVVTVPFTILEEAEQIEQFITDQGSMLLEMVKLGETWYCQDMSIQFDPIAARPNAFAKLETLIPGFGFGRLQ